MSEFHGRWTNEPEEWVLHESGLNVVTDDETDFWRQTWYDFTYSTGHFYYFDIEGDFTFQCKVEAEFKELYDQAGVMLFADEDQWIKAGIEFNDDTPMISSVVTNPLSDWSPGLFKGNPKKYWLRITLLKGCVRIQYSADGEVWPLLRLCSFPVTGINQIGVMCCTPTRKGLNVRFSEMMLTGPQDKSLHDLS